MRKIVLMLLALCLAVCCVAGLASCGGDTASTEQGGFTAPSGFELKSNGKLTWKKVDGATGYEVSVDGNRLHGGCGSGDRRFPRS